ncbi:tyrosine-type recombinase/integrase [Prevotella sp. S7 MS 2]|uniref:tyrosine-type recombinase/integrase n=1 Tax=Prevotella sp. S7 MS 2 TaxID=1287488 RepID=UPI000512B4EA|nr:tyrosine-type recombinase/integrase [Prevotella sp. S7 MS 2]KGI60926.1 recombinase [Prevotella sp. S7 MS 2]
MMIEKFLDYLKCEQNRSPLTVKSYADDLYGFEAYFKNLEGRLSWERIDSDVIRGWMESMMDKGNNAVSINRRLSALRSFYRFALSHKLVEKDPAYNVKGPKKSKPLPRFLRDSEMDRLLDDSSVWEESFESQRARCMIMMFYMTGVRLAELVNLENKDVDFVNRQIKVTGKRNKHRIIPFGDELCNVLLDYMKLRDATVECKSECLFLSSHGDKMTHPQVRNEVKKYLSMVCTLKKRTPHVLRHTFATSMLNHEAGLESVKKLLGHESLSTTEVYTHTTFEQLKHVYSKAHPRA